MPSQGAVPSQFAIMNVAAIKQVLQLVAGSGCGRSNKGIAISAKKSSVMIVGNDRTSVVDAYTEVLHFENHEFTNHLISNLKVKKNIFSSLN